jgi:arginyl-tRNA--protein-N-Asp/Glu arginylyltransferase
LTIEQRHFPQFYITAPSPCPYLPGRLERKIFTHLIGAEAKKLNDSLSHGGFRRSQNIAYRPACERCAQCISIRIPVERFRWTRTFRRTLAANHDLLAQARPAKVTGEHYALFRDYIDARHGEGGMVDMTVLDFAAMVEDSFVDTRLVEYRCRATRPLASVAADGPLLAVALIDVLADGLSMIYSFYDPAAERRSLGTFMILDHVARARQFGLPYVYLGYWVPGSAKMAYKARFLPQERLTADGWRLAER